MEEEFEKLNKERCGVLVGSGIGGMTFFEKNVHTYYKRGPTKVSPFFIPYIIPNMPGAMLGMDIGFMGPNYSISTACATANKFQSKVKGNRCPGKVSIELATSD